jgi:hypothetical protein
VNVEGCDEAIDDQVHVEASLWCTDTEPIEVEVRCDATGATLEIVRAETITETRVRTDSLSTVVAARVIVLVLTELRRELGDDPPSNDDEVTRAESVSTDEAPVRGAREDAMTLTAPASRRRSMATSLGVPSLAAPTAEVPAVDVDSSEGVSDAREDASADASEETRPHRGARTGWWSNRREPAAPIRWVAGGSIARHVGGLWLFGGEVGVDLGVVSLGVVVETGTAAGVEGELRGSSVRGRLGACLVAISGRSAFAFVEPRVTFGWVGARGRADERWRGVSTGTWLAGASLAIGTGLVLDSMGLELVGELGWVRGMRATTDDGTLLAVLHGVSGQLALRIAYGMGG